MKNPLLQKLPLSWRSAVAASLMLLPAAMMAQSETPYMAGEGLQLNGAEIAPGVSAALPTSGSPEALFDIQATYNLTDTILRGGMAAVAFHNNEFWVSQWASDTLRKFSQNGQFLGTVQIPGLTGVRSLTSDGTFLYAGVNTATIYQINPTTATLTGTNTVVNASVGTVRHCSYDPTLNSNAGGFWVGNFNTDLFAVSRAGTVLTSIPAGTHGLTGMYGSAYDPYSAGGPYLWVFAQMAPSNSMIHQVKLSTGTSTITNHDVMSDVGANLGLTSGLAGGLFITDQFVLGQKSIIGVIQGTPDNGLFAYELSDPVIPSYDAKLDGLRPVEGYTQIPLSQVFPESFEVQYFNVGQNTLDSIIVDYTVTFGASTVFTGTSSITNVAPAGTGSLLSLPFTPANGVGTYNVTATARTAASQPDSNSTNDAVAFSFQVTDSTFARDNNVPDGGAGYSVNAGTDYCWVTTNFTLYAQETLSAVWIKVASAVTGDSTRAVVLNTISGTDPSLELAQGSPVILTAGTTEYLLQIPGGITLPAGTYAFGCYQAIGKSIKLAQSTDLFTAGVNYFMVPGSPWTASGIQTARFIRPVFGTPVAVGVDANAGEFVQVYPNPSEGVFALAFTGSATESAQVVVLDAVGKTVYRQSVDATGQMVSINLQDQPAGVYFLQVDNGVQKATKRLMITK